MVYQWKGGFPNRGVDAQVVGERIEHLRNAHGGNVTPQLVVEDAADASAPTHPLFEWDDAKAANQHRMEQARSMLRNIVVTIEQRPTAPVRAFVCVQASGDEEKSYTSVVAAMEDPELRQQVLARAKAEIVQWRKRYDALEEFAHLFEQIDQLSFESIVQP